MPPPPPEMLRFDWCLIYSKPSGAPQTCPRPPLDPQGGSHFPTCRCWPLESCVSLLAGTLRACSAMCSCLSTHGDLLKGLLIYSGSQEVLYREQSLRRVVHSLEDTKDSVWVLSISEQGDVCYCSRTQPQLTYIEQYHPITSHTPAPLKPHPHTSAKHTH